MRIITEHDINLAIHRISKECDTNLDFDVVLFMRDAALEKAGCIIKELQDKPLETIKISNVTILKPNDIIRNKSGKIYRIQSYHENKESFKIGLEDSKDDAHSVITIDTLVKKEWEKVLSKPFKLK